MKQPIFIDKLRDGSLELSTFKNNYLVHQRYIGYTKRDAMRKFKHDLKLGKVL